jgi:lipoprotein-anchoring transpeptidase ErfK/SrfK
VREKGALDDVGDELQIELEQAERAESLFAAGMEAFGRDDLIAARAHLTEALTLGLPRPQLVEARATLTVIGRKTVFGSAILEGDLFVYRHVIAPGETLGQVAKRHNVTADFLASINAIPDKNQVRAGQTIKVVRGPFHIKVDKATYSLDVYLENTFLKHYTVGLGADDGTPSGEWVVSTKLVNPTYYPPRGGRIRAADDPENPLGERWIGLRGVAGDALGQQRYGIHGTIEPESIGRSQTLGCIRMHNADVAELFALVVPGETRVTVK